MTIIFMRCISSDTYGTPLPRGGLSNCAFQQIQGKMGSATIYVWSSVAEEKVADPIFASWWIFCSLRRLIARRIKSTQWICLFPAIASKWY